jgi:hypothetical protein
MTDTFLELPASLEAERVKVELTTQVAMPISMKIWETGTPQLF